MNSELRNRLMDWADKYNDPVYFQTDPIAFPREFLNRGSRLQDIEISAIFAAHFAWGRRAMIVRDCERFFDFVEWRPYDYVMSGDYRKDEKSIHRTIKWKDTADICTRLKAFYLSAESLEILDTKEIRERIFGQKPDAKAANKKINMLRRWFVRDDGKVDLGLWTHSSKRDLIIPLDIHVYNQAFELGLTSRKAKNIVTACEITDSFREIFPDDPAKGDFALFGYGITKDA